MKISLILIVIQVILYKFVSNDDTLSLFINDKNVENLNANIFKENVLNQQHASIVLFYLHWCGHCRKFAATWSKLAADIKNWRKEVKVAAINCADTINDKVCQAYEIPGFPAIYLFLPETSENDFPKSINVANEVTPLKHALLQNIQEWIYLKIQNFFINDNVKDELTRLADANGILIVQNSNSLSGLSIFLDLSCGENGANTPTIRQITFDNAKANTGIIAKFTGISVGELNQLLRDNGISLQPIQGAPKKVDFSNMIPIGNSVIHPSAYMNFAAAHSRRIRRALLVGAPLQVPYMRSPMVYYYQGQPAVYTTFVSSNSQPSAVSRDVVLVFRLYPDPTKMTALLPNYTKIEGLDYKIADVRKRINLNPRLFTDSTIPSTLPTTKPPPFTSITGPSDIFEATIVLNTKFKGQYQCVFAEDLENAVYQMLMHEVPRFSKFDQGSYRVLARMIHVLALFYPKYDDERINNFLLNMKNKLFPRTSGTTRGSPYPLTSRKYLDWMDDQGISTRVFPEQRRKWIGCRGSTPTIRGYTCGLWTLFHTLTVSAYKHPLSSPYQDGYLVLDIIRDYIRTFFGCVDCGQHFSQMSANLSRDLPYLSNYLIDSDAGIQRIPLTTYTSRAAFYSENRATLTDVSNLTSSTFGHPATAMFWLWSAHNKVNNRLAKDTSPASSNDPMAPKIQFPAHIICSNCSSTNSPGDWYYINVRSFLTKYYDVSGDLSENSRKIMPGGKCSKIPYTD